MHETKRLNLDGKTRLHRPESVLSAHDHARYDLLPNQDKGGVYRHHRDPAPTASISALTPVVSLWSWCKVFQSIFTFSMVGKLIEVKLWSLAKYGKWYHGSQCDVVLGTAWFTIRYPHLAGVTAELICQLSAIGYVAWCRVVQKKKAVLTVLCSNS